jgi:DNA sulfur modification protein DndB
MPIPFQVPALRGVMGDWIYYVTLLPFEEVCSRIKRTDEVHTSALLREWLQRALTNRSDNIAHYLKSHSQRFFNALVIGVYGGQPEWHEISLKKSELFDPNDLDERVADSLGFLALSGKEKLFAIDGQHRVEGIKRFVSTLTPAARKAIQDEVCAIFVAHKSSAQGMQRTRRLFSTLNRTAKPVSLTEIIALDEDDIIAIVCRHLLEHHRLFIQGRVSIAKQKSIGTDDRRNIISLVALHQAMNLYFATGGPQKWERFRATRPSEDVVKTFIDRADTFWNLCISQFTELEAVTRLKPDEDLPRTFRNHKDGGDLLFRPIFFPMVVRSLLKAAKQGVTEDIFIQNLARVPRKLNRSPWEGLLWDGTMITRSKNQTLAEDLILWMVGIPVREASLKQKLAEVLNYGDKEYKLPAKV